MKNKLIFYSFSFILFSSCSQEKQGVSENNRSPVNLKNSFEYKTSCFPSNDSFEYKTLIVTYPTESFRAIKRIEIDVDSSYIDCFNKLSVEDIVTLLRSENTDFATYVLLYKVYKDIVPSDLVNFTSIEDWRKKIKKEKMITNWESQLKQTK